jgi:hypothetical protein
MNQSGQTPAPQVLGEALLEAIRLVVRDEIRAALRPQRQSSTYHAGIGEAFLTIKEAADLSRIAPSTSGSIYDKEGSEHKKSAAESL